MGRISVEIGLGRESMVSLLFVSFSIGENIIPFSLNIQPLGRRDNIRAGTGRGGRKMMSSKEITYQYHSQDPQGQQHQHVHSPQLVQQVPMLYRPDHSLFRGLLIPVE